MKKVFVIASLCFLASCGSNSTDTTPSDSASAAPPDTSNAVNPPFPDSAKQLRDTSHILGDTSGGRDSSKN